MKKGFKYIFYVGSALTVFTSCGKKLDLTPPDSIIEQGALKDIPSLERGMTGVYASFNGGTPFNGGSYDADIYSSALYSDEATLPTENNTGRGVIAYRWQTDPGTSEVTAAFVNYYYSIDRANRIIAAAAALTGKSSTEETAKERIVGEATALRAFGHLQLLMNYAEGYEANALGIPYMETPAISSPARIPVSQVFAKIKADLAFAEQTLTGKAGTNNTRITLAAIYAIQAKAALYEKDWNTAITAAGKAIAAVPLATKTQYPLIWDNVGGSNAEVIFKFNRVAGETRIGDSYYDRSQQKVMYAPSKELIDLFDAVNDIRYIETIRDFGSGRYGVKKYTGNDAAQENLANVLVFRTAEMYLIRAEAYAELPTPNLTAGAKDLNDLRAARINGYAAQTFATKEDLVNAILTERFKELAFEGHRVFDLRRKMLPITRLPEDAVNALGAVTLAPTARQYYYPIHVDEMLSNNNMEQNSGYKK